MRYYKSRISYEKISYNKTLLCLIDLLFYVHILKIDVFSNIMSLWVGGVHL